MVSHATDGVDEVRHVDGLYKVLGKARVGAAEYVFLHTVSAHCDAWHQTARADGAHDFVAIAIGQAEIADQHIEMLKFNRGDGAGHVAGGVHGKTFRAEHAGEGARRVGMVFNEEEAEWGHAW